MPTLVKLGEEHFIVMEGDLELGRIWNDITRGWTATSNYKITRHQIVKRVVDQNTAIVTVLRMTGRI